MEVSLSSMFSRKTRTIRTIKTFSHLVQIRRNMTSCFGDGKCEIQFNKECVGLAFRQDKIYLLSLSDNVNVASSKNKNSSSYENVTKKHKQIDAISSKLWHYRLGHISRGRIERLVKASILPPLEFSELEHCMDCIKENLLRK